MTYTATAEERERRYRLQHEQARQRAAEHKHTTRIAKTLGVTASGLTLLGKAAVHPKGEIGGGVALVKLVKQGFAADRERNFFGCFIPAMITDAGREIVRRARSMGW